MKFVFLMDPLESIDPEKDTSLALMLGAKQNGHTVFYLADNGLFYKEGKVCFDVVEVEPDLDLIPPFNIKDVKRLNENQVDVVFIRKDPPFDEQYLFNTWLLDQLPDSVFVVNRPSGIRTANEKLWSLQFKNLIPDTLVTSKIEDLNPFIEKHGEIILKPVNGFGGKSIFHLKKGDLNANVAFETLSQMETQPVIVQEYLPEAKKGDKRILLLDGKPLGAVLRVHSKKDHRNNFFSGGKPERSEVTKRDMEIIKEIKPMLEKEGLFFVGIDIIGDCLIEINVTSPTCLQEINRLNKAQLEKNVIEFVEMKKQCQKA